MIALLTPLLSIQPSHLVRSSYQLFIQSGYSKTNGTMELQSPLKSPISLLLGFILVLHSLLRSRLTLLASLTAITTASWHLSSPSPLPFQALILFFLLGTLATRLGRQQKHTLTLSATGGSGAEGPRAGSQVLANSAAASLMLLASALGLISERAALVGVCAAYAAAAADTLGSEIGVLAEGTPRMIIPPFEEVPRGTNGGVSLLGLVAGFMGSSAVALLWNYYFDETDTAFEIALLGLGGSLIDSILGAVAQRTVVDRKTGRVVEGANGRRVLFREGGSRTAIGRDWLNNNGVNFAMTMTVAVAAAVVEMERDGRV